MEKSFTPHCTPEQFEKLMAESHMLYTAKPGLVKDIMAYVRSTRVFQTKFSGDLKLFLN